MTMTQGISAEVPLVGQTIAGKYKVIRLLGEGGMGCVYLAEQQLGSAARKVALKTLHKHLSHDASIQARFDREAGTVAALQHPNTIQVFDYGKMDDGTLYIVMEFVQGRSVADILEKDGPMPPARVEHIMRQVCGSLEEAHIAGIIHRDLKPDNVVLCDRAGQKDWVEVLDFGIAKRSNEHDPNEAKLTQQGMVLGTPPYMSPEQFTGQPIDSRSDIYAIGVMAYEMLTANLPFQANTAWEWASKHMTELPTPLERQPLGAQVPEAMRAAIMKALSKNRDDRFATAHEFIDAFTGTQSAQGTLGMGAPAVSVASAASGGAPGVGATAAMGTPPGFGAVPGQPGQQAQMGGHGRTEMAQPAVGAVYTPPAMAAYGPPPAAGGFGPGVAPYQQAFAGVPARKGKGRYFAIAMAAVAAVVLLGGGSYALLSSKKPSTGASSAQTSPSAVPSTTAHPEPTTTASAPPPPVPPVEEPQTTSVPALDSPAQQSASAQKAVATPPAGGSKETPKAATPTPKAATPTPKPAASIPTPIPHQGWGSSRGDYYRDRGDRSDPPACAQARSARSNRMPAAIIASLENRCRSAGGTP
ncbi:MAG: protein kinase [Polyangiaceae bacterium]|nr:protein kinase [Polyangiaceae bacterium]